MGDQAIVVEGLAKRYGELAALDGIDLQVEEGTIFGLLGPNGAGKTTAVRILATILAPDAGRAEVLGHDVVREPAAVRLRIGLAGQYAAVDPNLTGRENLRMVGMLGQLPRSAIAPRADELLERFSLADAADRPLRTYSGGMRRRLDIAASLVPRPPVLFLDEPTTGPRPHEPQRALGHDPGAGRRGHHGAAHDPVPRGSRPARGTGRRHRRRARDRERCARARSRPTSATPSSRWTSPTSRWPTRAVGLLGGDGVGSVERDGRTVRVSSDRGARVLVDVLRRFDGDGVEPDTLSVREPSLDDVFLALTGASSREALRPTRGAAA